MVLFAIVGLIGEISLGRMMKRGVLGVTTYFPTFQENNHIFPNPIAAPEQESINPILFLKFSLFIFPPLILIFVNKKTARKGCSY